MPKEPKTYEQIIDKHIAGDKELKVIGKISLSGSVLWIGTAGDCLWYTDDEVVREPTYFSIPEAKLMRQLLNVSIAELEGDN